MGTIRKNLSLSQLRELEKFGGKVNKFGVNFAVCNAGGELVLLCDGSNKTAHSGRRIAKGLKTQNHVLSGVEGSKLKTLECYALYAKRCVEIESEGICRLGEHNQILAAALKSGSEAVGVALIDLSDISSCIVRDVSCDIRNTIFSEMLAFLAENFQAAAKAEKQIEMVSTELSQAYEELVLLHKLSTNMKVTEPDSNFLQMACDSLTDMVSVEGIAILLEKTMEDEKQLVLVAGLGLIDINERMAAVLHSRLVEQIDSGKEALLDSEVDSPFRYEWSDSIKNIIAVPLFGKDKTGSGLVERTPNGDCIIGLMVAVNRLDKPDFDSPDVKLFNSVANRCAVFIENGRLFGDLKELFVGSLKALTSSIDAKDQYTRGHSERVAFISRWIAERFTGAEPLQEEQIHKIYLAGLLHDIGKIGIDEAVLRKNGKLTEQELMRIKTHPSIGAGILNEIKQMRDIVPGVLCHHEQIDGKGYPSGLVGEQIPLIGKIVGLADSFDAMTSKRAYRDAMTVEEALAEIEKGLGTQFDEEVGKIFINSEVYHLWSIIQDGFTDVYGAGSSVEYGTEAVGSIIR